MGVYTKTKDGLKRLDGSDSVQGKLDSHEKNSNIHVTAAEKSRWEKGGDLAKHESNHYIHMQEDDTGELNIVDDNGYVIAKVDAEGLNAKNVKVDGKPVSKMIEEAIEGFEPGDDSEGLTNHINNKGNPHEVSKEQVGLGNVDNTSDKDKPVSTAQQAALNNLGKELSENVSSETDKFNIVDSNGNIIAQIDSNGINSVDFLLGHKSLKPVLNDGTDGLQYSISYSNNNDLTEQWDNGTRICEGIGTAVDTKIRIASHVDGCPVTSIQYAAFRDNATIERVDIPRTVTSIGAYAFSGCVGLVDVVIPDGVQEIPQYAFYQSGLERVVIGSGVKTIEQQAFRESNVVDVFIPDGVTTIAAGAFAYCPNLKSIRIPGGVSTVDTGAFCENPLLERVYMGVGVKFVKNMFMNCVNLTYIFYNGTVEQWQSEHSNMTWFADTAAAGTPDNLIIYCWDGTIAKDGTITKMSDFAKASTFTSRGGLTRTGVEYANTAVYAERSAACFHRIQVVGAESDSTQTYGGSGRGVLFLVDSQSTEHTIGSLIQFLKQYGATGSKTLALYSTLFYPMNGVIVAGGGGLTVPVYGIVVGDDNVLYGVGFDYTKDVSYYFPVTSITDAVRSV